MKVTKYTKRFVALVICLIMLAALAAPAMALTLYPRSVVTSTPVYSYPSGTSSQIGSFNAGDIIGVVGKVSGMEYYKIYDQTSKQEGYVPTATVSTAGAAGTITAMRAVNGSIASTAPVTSTTGTTSGTAGYVTNCTSWVYYRSSASTASSARAGKINKNTAITITGNSGSFTQCLYNGSTVYIDSRYVATGTPSSSSSSSTSSGTATITNCSSWVSMRKSASSSSTRLYKLNKGTSVTVLGTSGSYTKVSYKGKTGYVLSTYVGGSSGGSTTTTGSSKVGTGSVRVARGTSTLPYATKNTQNQYQATNSDVVGITNILNTMIVQPILYDSTGKFYYHDHDYTRATSSSGAIYSLYNGMPRNNVLSGHNMRQSNGMFHKLHHLQEKALGYNTCQAVGAGVNHDISDVPDLNQAANRTWEIGLAGYTQWQVWAFYEVDATEPASTITFNCQHLSTSTPTQIKTWIDTQIARAASSAKGKYFNTDLSTDDVFMTLITCGDGYDSADAQSRLYFFLKAVK